jgi:type IV secretory pathway protease TraF
MTWVGGRWLCMAWLVCMVGWGARQWVPHLLVYAPSNSVAKGWYVRAVPYRPPQVGDLIVLTPSEAMVAAMPPELPRARVLKEVAGVQGMRVCWQNQEMRVETDGAVQRYPWHPEIPAHYSEGCSQLGPDMLVVVGQHPRSFDSRYIGPVPCRLVQFRVWPLWTWEGQP